MFQIQFIYNYKYRKKLIFNLQFKQEYLLKKTKKTLRAPKPKVTVVQTSEDANIVFKFSDYKLYLKKIIEVHERTVKGYRTKLADHCQMNRSYLPQILNSKAQLSEEQSLRCANFLGLNPIEIRFFQNLVRYSKTSSADLRSHLGAELKSIQLEAANLAHVLKDTEQSNEEIASHYYSQWFFSAIHIATYNVKLRSPFEIGRYLNLELQVVQKVLKYLERVKLVQQTPDGLYVPLESNFHLPKDSVHSFKHHANWKIKALEALERPIEHNFHYSSVFGISKKDLMTFKSHFVKFVSSTRNLIKESNPEEELCAYTIDFFGIYKNN